MNRRSWMVIRSSVTPGSEDAMLVALDKLTGKTIWQSKVPGASGGSPGGLPAVALATVLLAGSRWSRRRRQWCGYDGHGNQRSGLVHERAFWDESFLLQDSQWQVSCEALLCGNLRRDYRPRPAGLFLTMSWGMNSKTSTFG